MHYDAFSSYSDLKDYIDGLVQRNLWVYVEYADYSMNMDGEVRTHSYAEIHDMSRGEAEEYNSKGMWKFVPAYLISPTEIDKGVTL